jgi:hypothetical protein
MSEQESLEFKEPGEQQQVVSQPIQHDDQEEESKQPMPRRAA